MRVKALQRGDCQAVKERRVLGQSLDKVLGQSMVQTPDRDMVWALDTGSRCGPVPGRYDGLDIG